MKIFGPNKFNVEVAQRITAASNTLEQKIDRIRIAIVAEARKGFYGVNVDADQLDKPILKILHDSGFKVKDFPGFYVISWKAD